MEKEVITLGAGCFWCTEAVFLRVRGVLDAVPGYSGGHKPNPTYEEVCTGETGHAEVAQVTFDPSVISLSQILDVFFAIHDPTSLNRQGNDIGTQYRSVVFYHTPQQREVALKKIRELQDSGEYDRPIVTSVEPFTAFYPAEDYHMRFYDRNPNYPYCRVIVSPKVKKLFKEFPTLAKEEVRGSGLRL